MRRRGRPKHPDILTPREWEVLALLRDGLAKPEIAERLGVTRDAVKYHVSEILSKLALASREEAAVCGQPSTLGGRRPSPRLPAPPAGCRPSRGVRPAGSRPRRSGG